MGVWSIEVVADESNTGTTGSYGDSALGRAYETVLIRELDGGLFETLTIGYYVEMFGSDDDCAYFVLERSESLTFADLDDRGGSEVNCDYAYGEGSYEPHSTLDAAEAAARRSAESFASWTLGPNGINQGTTSA
jgi:hypothetical protein